MSKIPLTWCFFYPATNSADFHFISEDFLAQKFGYAIKEYDFKGYAEIMLTSADGKETVKKFYNKDRNELKQVILRRTTRIIKQKISSIPSKEQIALIPVPNSDATSKRHSFKTANDTCFIANNSKGEIISRPYLRWQSAQPQSHDSGSRDATILEGKLCLSQDIPEKYVILYDDIMTTGGHLIACAKYLQKQNHVVILCVVAGKTVWEHHDNMIKPVEDELDLTPPNF